MEADQTVAEWAGQDHIVTKWAGRNHTHTHTHSPDPCGEVGQTVRKSDWLSESRADCQKVGLTVKKSG